MTDPELGVLERRLMDAARASRAKGDAWKADRLEEASGAIARALFGKPKGVLYIEPTDPPVPPGA